MFYKRTFFLIVFITLFLSACGNKIDFTSKGRFIQLQLYSASEGTLLDHFPQFITIYHDGTIEMYTENMLDRHGEVELETEGAPVAKKTISNKEVDHLKQKLEDKNFLSLDEDLTDYHVMDGGGSRITVYMKDNEKIVGGNNVDNKKYNEIKDIIYAYVEDEYKDWYDETRDYLAELNNIKD